MESMDIAVAESLAQHVRQLEMVRGDQPAATNAPAAYERRAIDGLLGLLEKGQINNRLTVRARLQELEVIDLGGNANERLRGLLERLR